MANEMKTANNNTSGFKRGTTKDRYDRAKLSGASWAK